MGFYNGSMATNTVLAGKMTSGPVTGYIWILSVKSYTYKGGCMVRTLYWSTNGKGHLWNSHVSPTKMLLLVTQKSGGFTNKNLELTNTLEIYNQWRMGIYLDESHHLVVFGIMGNTYNICIYIIYIGSTNHFVGIEMYDSFGPHTRTPATTPKSTP